MTITDSRQLAYNILSKVIHRRGFASDLLRSGNIDSLSRVDRSFLTEIVYGVLRWMKELDFYISFFSGRAVVTIDKELLLLLRLGMYQIFHLDRVPDSAAVNETVELAKRIGNSKKAGFVNAVLRNSIREKENIAFPDFNSNPTGYISDVLSQPDWLVRRWVGNMGKDKARLLAERVNKPMPLMVRVNLIRTDRAGLLSALRKEGVDAVESEFSEQALKVSGKALKTDLFRKGFFYVQGLSSQLTGLLVRAEEGAKILDCCCAPGGKLTYIASSCQESTVYGMDINYRKLKMTRKNCQKLGVKNIRLLCGSAYCAPFKSAFHTVLLDAPCSGLGTIRANPEIKWRVSPDDIDNYHQVQAKMINSMAEFVMVGGELIYSVCSMEEEETFQVIDWFLERNDNFELLDAKSRIGESCYSMISHKCFLSKPYKFDMDGFFAAILRRKS